MNFVIPVLSSCIQSVFTSEPASGFEPVWSEKFLKFGCLVVVGLW
jgi:hypothetical protein